MRAFRRLLAAALLLSCALPAQAAYKCSIDGKVVYGDQPCPDGKALKLSGNEHVAPADAAAARQRAEHERRLLASIETTREREQSRAAAEARRAAVRASAEKKNCDALALRVKWKEEDVRTATGRSVERARRDARRALETWTLRCGK